MRNIRKIIINNSILILIITILCIIVPIGYIYLDSIIFNTTIVKSPEKEYNPPIHTTFKLQAKNVDLKFSHLSAPTQDFKNIIYIYKDSDGNEYYFDSIENNLLGINFNIANPEVPATSMLTNDKLKMKAEEFVKGILDFENYEFDEGNNSFDNERVVLSWSRHANKVPTCDSVAVTMYKDGSIKSLVINNYGFYDDNIAKIPVIVDEYSDEATAQTEGSNYLINSLNLLHGTNIVSCTKKYSKLEIDTDLQLYWEFVFHPDALPGDFSNGVKSEYVVKVKAFKEQSNRFVIQSVE